VTDETNSDATTDTSAPQPFPGPQQPSFRAPPAILSIQQFSQGGTYFGMGFFAFLLSIVTLTLWRFWARAQFRARLWSETQVDGDPLEYTGTGWELFKGFLIFFFVFGLPYGLFVLAVQSFLSDGWITVISFAVLPILLWLFAFGTYMARRYLLSRTKWRGIKFAMTGKATRYANAFLGYSFISVFTLGWYWPTARLRLAGMMWRDTLFGDTRFRFDSNPGAQTENIYGSYALAWFGPLIVMVLALFVIVPVGLLINAATEASEDPAAFAPLVALALIVIYASSILGALAFAGWHEVVIWRQTTKLITLHGATFRLNASAWSMVKLRISNILILIFTLGIGFMYVSMRTWRWYFQRLVPEGSLDVENIRQSSAAGPKTGEGIADSFDSSFGF
jgi:uncharacterized membrane protein YjgN (DUF898 family)